jgi:hypothetical protein
MELTDQYLLPLDTEFSPPPIDTTGQGLTRRAMCAPGAHVCMCRGLRRVACAGKTIFMSVATYRDENCPTTLTEAFKHVSHSAVRFL